MNIKVTNMTLLNILNLLDKFGFVTGELGYAIAKSKQQMLEKILPFGEKRKAILEKYGEADENGNYKINQESEHYNEYANEIVSIAEEMIDLELIQVSKEVFDATDIYRDELSSRDYEMLQTLFRKNDYFEILSEGNIGEN